MTVLAATSWLTLERVMRMGAALAVSVLLARHLGTSGYGTFSYVLASVALFSEIATLGLNAILVRDLVEARGTSAERAILGTAGALRLVGGAASIALSTAFVTVTRPDDSAVLMLTALYASGLVFRAAEVCDLYFQARTQARGVAITRMASFLIVALAIVTGIALEATLTAFVVMRAAEFVFIATGYVLAYRASNAPPMRTWHFDGKLARKMLSRSWPLVLSGLSATVYLKVDQVMLGVMKGDSAVGVYAVAAQLSEVWYFLPQAIAIAVFPSLLEARRRNTGEYERGLQRLFDVLASAAYALTIGVVALAGPMVRLLYGPDYALAGSVLTIHIWSSIFVFMRAGLSKWLVAEELYLFSLVTHGAGAVVNVVANLMLIPAFGPNGAAVATLVSYMVASYGALAFHPRTRRIGASMSLALIAPIRWPLEALSRRRRPR